MEARFIKIAVSILFIWVGTIAGLSFSLAWDAPDSDDYLPDGYIILHGTISGAYSDWHNAGRTNVYEWQDQLPAGVNYFNAVAMAYDDVNGLQLSALSNEIVVTNTPQLVLTTIILSSTNITGAWSPWSTNSVQFSPSLAQEFFKTSLGISNINVITISAPK